jgi:hypothetical protein
LSNQFTDFCELLWASWLSGTLNLRPALAHRFDISAAPEPYLSFDAGSWPLIALTTNPGGMLPFQQRQAILTDASPVSGAMNYATAAVALADHYRKILQRQPAGRRIESVLRLASLVSADGVLQVEACPFHSRALPNKSALLVDLQHDPLLSEYIRHLRAFLVARPVVIVSAASAQASLTPESSLSPWLTWQAENAGTHHAPRQDVRR